MEDSDKEVSPNEIDLEADNTKVHKLSQKLQIKIVIDHVNETEELEHSFDICGDENDDLNIEKSVTTSEDNIGENSNIDVTISSHETVVDVANTDFNYSDVKSKESDINNEASQKCESDVDINIKCSDEILEHTVTNKNTTSAEYQINEEIPNAQTCTVTKDNVDINKDKNDIHQDNVDIHKDNNDINIDNIDISKDNIDIPKDNDNINKDNIDINKDKFEICKDNKDIHEDSVDIPKENVEVNKENNDILQDNVDIHKNNFDICKDNIDIHEDNVDIRKDNVDINKDNNDIHQDNFDIPKDNVEIHTDNVYISSSTDIKEKDKLNTIADNKKIGQVESSDEVENSIDDSISNLNLDVKNLTKSETELRKSKSNECQDDKEKYDFTGIVVTDND